MEKTTLALIGAGGFASYILPEIMKHPETEVVGLAEPSEKARERMRQRFEEKKVGRPVPPYFESFEEMLAEGVKPEVCYIITPHKYHIEHIRACLTNDIHVLVEKPMVLDQEEAREVIRLRDEHGKLVVVGFPGSLSPAMAKAKALIAAGKIGTIQGVTANAFQQWKKSSAGTWRQVPELSGGGFLFDTGSHLINTMVDVIGSPVATIYAMMDDCEAPVEINSTITGRFQNGVMLSVLGIGNSVGCEGDIRIVGDQGVMEIGMWGHHLREFTPGGEKKYTEIDHGESKNVWQNFMDVLKGRKANPSPAEVGLRFAQIMDMIRESAATGLPVQAG